MTSFLDIWDTEYYFGRTDLTFDLNVPQRGGSSLGKAVVFPCCNPFYLRQSSSLLLNSRYVLTAAGVCGFIAFSRPMRPVTSGAYSVAPSARNRKLSWSNKNNALLRSRLSL
jgi:hypothetical protein